MTPSEQILVSAISGSVAAIITAILAYYGFWRQAKAQLMKEYHSRFNEKKWEIYLSFVKLIPIKNEVDKLRSRQVDAPNPDKPLTDAEQQRYDSLYNQFYEANRIFGNKVLLISSSKVIKSFSEWVFLDFDFNKSREEKLSILVKLINNMREDLGMEKSNIDLKMLDGGYYLSKETRDKIPF